MLNHLKWHGSCYLKWQSEKRKWPISLLMWHSNKTQWVYQTGQLAADGALYNYSSPKSPDEGENVSSQYCARNSSPLRAGQACIRESSVPIGACVPSLMPSQELSKGPVRFGTSCRFNPCVQTGVQRPNTVVYRPVGKKKKSLFSLISITEGHLYLARWQSPGGRSVPWPGYYYILSTLQMDGTW